VLVGETIDLNRLLGVSCTLVVSHQQSVQGAQPGRIYASIDAISKPTKKLTPSGKYDPLEARERLAETRAKEMAATQFPSGFSVPRSSPNQQPMAKLATATARAMEPEPAVDVGF